MAVFNNNRILFAATTEPATLIEKTITENGTYTASDDNASGYSAVKVEVAGGGSENDMLQARVDATNSCYYLFYYYAGTTLDISRLNTSNVTNMKYMFAYCENLQQLDLSNFDTSNVTDFSLMFQKCVKLTELNVKHFNTSDATTFQQMFNSCEVLTELDLSGWSTSNVTTFYYMFGRCLGLIEANLSGWDTSNLTTIEGLFTACRALNRVDISGWNTSKVSSIRNAFQGCQELTEIIGTLNLFSAVLVNQVFENCKKLTNVTLKNIRQTLQLGSGTTYGHLLSLDSLTNAINELWDLTGSTALTLTIGSANLEKLANIYVKLVTITDEMRAKDEYIDNKLPCVVCESTDEGAMLITQYAEVLKNWVIQ